MKKFAVILNPCSGSSDGKLADSIREALQQRQCPFDWHETTPAIDAGQLAAEAVREGARHVIVGGGDGTVMAAVNGLATTAATDDSVILSIIPAGTANLLATALEIPAEPAAAMNLALAGNSRLIDLGRCGDTLFALGLGLGLTERLVSQTSAKEKETLGKLAYARAMLSELGARPTGFTFSLDGQAPRHERGVAIVVANCGTIGGGLRFAPDARMDDGLLDLCILHRFAFRDFLRMVLRSLLGRLREDRAVSFHKGRRITIETDPPLHLQIDGEVVDSQVPLVVEVLPGALRVTVPAS